MTTFGHSLSLLGWSAQAQELLMLFSIPVLVACPVATVLCLFWIPLTLWQRLAVLAVEGAIVFAHLLALLPSVQ